MEFKKEVTPLGRQLSAHTASVRRTSGSDCIGWPTPNAGPQNDNDSTWMQRRSELKEKHGNNGFGLTLGMAAQIAWPTPCSQDGPNGGPSQGTDRLPGAAAWATPIAADSRMAGGRQQTSLPNQASGRYAWSTPAARDFRDTGDLSKSEIRKDQKKRTGMIARDAFGMMANGESEQTAKRASLNPELSQWLMGYSEEWLLCAPQESAKRLQKNIGTTAKEHSKDSGML